MKKRHHWRDLGMNLRIIMDLIETGYGREEWIHLVRDTDQRQALVNTAMKLRVS
jgi:hypothetical protein